MAGMTVPSKQVCVAGGGGGGGGIISGGGGGGGGRTGGQELQPASSIVAPITPITSFIANLPASPIFFLFTFKR